MFRKSKNVDERFFTQSGLEKSTFAREPLDKLVDLNGDSSDLEGSSSLQIFQLEEESSSGRKWSKEGFVLQMTGVKKVKSNKDFF